MRRSLSIRTPWLAAVAAALLVSVDAQLTQPGVPASRRASLAAEVPTLVMPRPDIEGMMLEDELDGPFPYRYGAVVETRVGLDDAGLWEETADGYVWRVRISSPGAYSLGIVFDEYNLPVGGQVYLYDASGNDVHGAYTDLNNSWSDSLGVEPIAGDTVTIEYVHPRSATQIARLRVGQVIHDYRDVLTQLGISPPNSGTTPVGGSCLIDINCPQGANYQDVKRAVMRTLAGGALCSASLLNNTNEDETPYMLTANHCGNMTNGVFLFNYERNGCASGGTNGGSTLSGAQLLTASGGVDSQLYRLNTTPPFSLGAFWAGWDRRTTSPSPAVCIGHGLGQPKQIATDNTGASLAGSDWQAFWHSGQLEGGNSGGPLFNGSKRVIGPACCVSTFNCGVQTAWFGRFDIFYNNNNLAQWLDPAGTAPLFIDGHETQVTTGPFDLLGVIPSTMDALMPGSDKAVAITGTGFTPTTTVEIDNQPLPGVFLPYQFVTPNLIELDMPQLDSLGQFDLTVRDGASSDSETITVVAPATPKLQVASGDIGANVFSLAALPFVVSGQPNALHLVIFSRTNLPSVSQFVTLSLGNNFTQVPFLNPFIIDPVKGWSDRAISPSSIPGQTTFYFQSIDFSTGSFPLDVSNFQEIFVVF